MYEAIILIGPAIYHTAVEELTASTKDLIENGTVLIIRAATTRDELPSDFIETRVNNKIDKDTRVFLWGHGSIMQNGNHKIKLIEGLTKTSDVIEYIAQFGPRNFDLMSCRSGVCSQDIPNIQNKQLLSELNVIAHADDNLASSSIISSITARIIKSDHILKSQYPNIPPTDKALLQLPFHSSTPATFYLEGKDFATRTPLLNIASDQTLKDYLTSLSDQIYKNAHDGAECPPDLKEYSQQDLLFMRHNLLMHNLLVLPERFMRFISNAENNGQLQEIVNFLQTYHIDGNEPSDVLHDLMYFQHLNAPIEPIRIAVDACIKAGATIDPKKRYNGLTDKNLTLLMLSITDGLRMDAVDIVENCINAGIDINAKSTKGHTALTLAIDFDHDDLVNKLLLHNPEILRHKIDGKDALEMSYNNTHITTNTIMKLLARALDEAPANTIMQKTDSTHKALCHILASKEAISDELLEKLGKDWKDARGNTLVDLARAQKNSGSLEKIVAMTRQQTETNMHHAIHDAGQVLLEHSAQPTVSNHTMLLPRLTITHNHTQNHK